MKEMAAGLSGELVNTLLQVAVLDVCVGHTEVGYGLHRAPCALSLGRGGCGYGCGRGLGCRCGAEGGCDGGARSVEHGSILSDGVVADGPRRVIRESRLLTAVGSTAKR